MELLFRKYFWAVELALLALASFLFAMNANAFLASQLAPKVNVEEFAQDPRSAAAPVFGRAGRLDLEKSASLLGITLPVESPEQFEVPEEPEFDPDAPPVQSSLRASLVGTMVANRPEWSFATIRDDSTKDSTVYLVGDTILGAEILEIERLRVILLNEGRKEFLSIEGGDKPQPPPRPSPSPASRKSSAPATDEAEVIKVGENDYEISREDVEKQLSNLNSIATQARIVPSFKNGEANGFKVFSIRPGSIYQKLGIRNGDVIQKINGYEINSPDKALEVYAKLKEASKIEVELERRGQVTRSSVTIK